MLIQIPERNHGDGVLPATSIKIDKGQYFLDVCYRGKRGYTNPMLGVFREEHIFQRSGVIFFDKSYYLHPPVWEKNGYVIVPTYNSRRRRHIKDKISVIISDPEEMKDFLKKKRNGYEVYAEELLPKLGL